MTDNIEFQNSKVRLRAEAEAIVQNKISQLHHEIEGMSINELKKMFEEFEIHKIELEMQNEELRDTQEQLSLSKEKYFDLYNLAPVGYITMNSDGIITALNLTAATMLGVIRSSVIQKNFSMFISFEDQDKCYLYRKRILESGQTQSCDMLMFKEDKKTFWAHLVGKLVQDQKSNFSIAIIISDITELKKAQEELKIKDEMIIAQSRQVAMGEMISMIAHQWRQPLSVVSMAINNIKASKAFMGEISNEEFNTCTTIVSDKVQHLSETISNFITFFKPTHDTEVTTLEEILNTTFDIIGKCLENNNIKVYVQNGVKNSFVISKASLIQVLLNILANAKEAILAKNRVNPIITITAKEIKDTISISICDNAGGIEPSVINKIGEPYFTTKEELNGSGLGIYISKTIVEKHFFGNLTWYNEGDGACFVVTIKI